MNNHKLVFISLFLFSSLVSQQVFADITISDPWISEAPPTVTILAGYARITNLSKQTISLTSVSSPTFAKIELHQSTLVDGTARMEKQGSLTLGAESSVELSPGGYHLMLFNPDRLLKTGDTVDIVFNFSDDSSKSIAVPVKKRNNDGHDHHHHH